MYSTRSSFSKTWLCFFCVKTQKGSKGPKKIKNEKLKFDEFKKIDQWCQGESEPRTIGCESLLLLLLLRFLVFITKEANFAIASV